MTLTLSLPDHARGGNAAADKGILWPET